MRRKKKTERRGRLGIYAIAAVALLLVLVLGLQTVKLGKTRDALNARQTQLNEQIAQEEVRNKTLEEERIYTRTKQFIEEQARAKFGLVMPDEVLIKGKD